jgi:bifunctional DNA-binding transcriptional regulator/antitoxin component of YhaV-PrlF toxin-antitoxin module
MESKQASQYSYRTIGMVGSCSFCVVLPKEYAIDLGISKGDPVRVTRKARKKKMDSSIYNTSKAYKSSADNCKNNNVKPESAGSSHCIESKIRQN